MHFICDSLKASLLAYNGIACRFVIKLKTDSTVREHRMDSAFYGGCVRACVGGWVAGGGVWPFNW